MGGGASQVAPTEFLDAISRWDVIRLKSLVRSRGAKGTVNISSSRTVQLPGHDPLLTYVTPLVFAIIVDCVEAVKILLNSSHVDVNIGGDAERAETTAVKYLQKGSGCQTCGTQVLYTPLTMAIALHRKAIVELLLEHSHINNEAGSPAPLATAALCGNFDASVQLLNRGVAQQDFFGHSPLRLAIETQQEHLVSLLAGMGEAKVESLVAATRLPSVGIVGLLLSNPAIDINASVEIPSPSNGPPVEITPLFSAVQALRPPRRPATASTSTNKICTCNRTAKLPCVQLLLESADKPLCSCAQLPQPPGALKSTAVLEALLKDPRLDPNLGKQLPLESAAAASNIRGLKLVLRHPKVSAEHITSALFASVTHLRDREATEVLSSLLAHQSAKPTGQTEEESVVFTAVKLHRTSALHLLLRTSGVDVNQCVTASPSFSQRIQQTLGLTIRNGAPTEEKPQVSSLYAATDSPAENEEDRWKTIQILLSHPQIDPNLGISCPDGLVVSPLIVAIHNQQWKAAQAITEHARSDVNLSEPQPTMFEGSKGRSPLCMALQHRRTPLVDAILKHPGVDTELGCVIDDKVHSCLEYCVIQQHSGFVDRVLSSSSTKVTDYALELAHDKIIEAQEIESRRVKPANEVRVMLQEAITIADALVASPHCPQGTPQVERINEALAKARSTQPGSAVPKNSFSVLTGSNEGAPGQAADTVVAGAGSSPAARPGSRAGGKGKKGPKPRLNMLLAPGL